MSETKSVSLGFSKRLYQKTIATFLISFLIGIVLLEYFVDYKPLKTFVDNTVQWGTIISALSGVMALAFLVTNNVRGLSRNISAEKRDLKRLVGNAIFLGVYVMYIALGISDPKLEQGTNFTLLFITTTALISIGIYSMGEINASWMSILRLSNMNTLETYVLFAGFLIRSLVRPATTTVFYAIFPNLVVVQDWLQYVPYGAVMRATNAAAGIGGIVLGIRALALKEPGLVEMEVSK